jgi:hypothetical protein
MRLLSALVSFSVAQTVEEATKLSLFGEHRVALSCVKFQKNPQGEERMDIVDDASRRATCRMSCVADHGPCKDSLRVAGVFFPRPLAKGNWPRPSAPPLTFPFTMRRSAIPSQPGQLTFAQAEHLLFSVQGISRSNVSALG